MERILLILIVKNICKIVIIVKFVRSNIILINKKVYALKSILLVKLGIKVDIVKVVLRGIRQIQNKGNALKLKLYKLQILLILIIKRFIA